MKGITFLVASAICLATIGTFVKLVDGAVSPFLLTAIRTGAAGLFILLLLSAKRKPVYSLCIRRKNYLSF